MKCAIYNRTSTDDQNPENQLKDCEELAKRLGFEEYTYYKEHVSAFKNEHLRDEFNKLKKDIKPSTGIKVIVVWDLDRIYRNRKLLIEFFEYCKLYKCKIYSYRQQFLEDINKAPAPWNEMLFDNMIFIMGWIAEEESQKRSERVKAAIKRDEDGQAYSKYSGKVWGRRSLTALTKRRIIEQYNKGRTMRQIKKGMWHWDKDGNKKPLSLGSVHKVIAEYKAKKQSSD